MNDTLIYNYVMDIKKKDISKSERAQIIKEYLDSSGKSIRQFAKEVDIPKSTIEDWLLWSRIEPKEYIQMKDNNLNDTEIYRTLRDGKKDFKKELLERTKIDFHLELALKSLNKFIDKPNHSKQTRKLMDKLYDTLNKILIKVPKE